MRGGPADVTIVRRRDRLSRAGQLLLLLGSVAMIGLRFVHLEADFPVQLDWSTAAYTDEGWYSNGAARHHLTGHWYREGDFNPMVAMPVFHLAQAITFGLFGMSLFTARLTAVLFFITMVALVFQLVRRSEGLTAALLAVFLLTMGFQAFLSSRLALLDLPMTMWLMLSLVLAWSFPPKRWLAAALLSALALSLGVLTKTLALFGAPAIAYATWCRYPDRRRKMLASLAMTGGVIAIVGGYCLFTLLAFPGEWRYFQRVSFGDRLSTGALDMLRRVPETLRSGRELYPLLYSFGLPAAALSWVTLRGFRRRKLAGVMLLWTIAFFLVLNASTYQPHRYYLPLTVPVAVLASLLTLEIHRTLGGRRHLRYVGVLPWAALGFAGCLQVGAINRYLSHPEYSLRDMGREVRERARSEVGEDATIVGHFADTISLASGLQSVNDLLGTRDLSWRLRRYDPDYFVALVYDQRMISLLETLGLVGDREPDREALLRPEVRAALDAWGLPVTARRAPDGRIYINAGIQKIRDHYTRVQSLDAPWYHMSDYVPGDAFRKIEARYRVEPVAQHDLFRSYFYHTVYVFRLMPKTADGSDSVDRGVGGAPRQGGNP